jgi:hypothetical protein
MAILRGSALHAIPNRPPIRHRPRNQKNCGQKHAGDEKKGKKIKEVLTHYRHFGYKRRFIPKFKLHFITVHEKEIHFAIRVF